MKKIAVLCFVALACCLASYAQEDSNVSTDSYVERSSHQLGFNAGGSTGLGLAYRYWPAKYGFQVTFLPIISRNTTFISASLTGLFKIKEYERTDLYGYIGNHFLRVGNNFSLSSNTYNLGAGIGIDIMLVDRLNLNLMFGYGGYDLTDDPLLLIDGGISLFFKL